jgi:hypothetical protein
LIPAPAGTGSSAFHGIAGDRVRFGVATWFADVLVRFGYDLPEHEHPWDGEWIDDAFEAAARDLRSTGSKLLRALARIDADRDGPAAAAELPLSVDLALGYLGRLVHGLTVALPCCYGVEGRALLPARGVGLERLAEALTPLDPRAAATLSPPDEVSAILGTPVPTASRELYPVIDAAGSRPPLPAALARTASSSLAVTVDAIGRLDRALAAACPWFDRILGTLQLAIAERAEDGDELVRRWCRPDWSVLGPATPAAVRHLPAIG